MCTSPDEVAAAERAESWPARRLSRLTLTLTLPLPLPLTLMPHRSPLASHTHSGQQPYTLQQPTSIPTACETGDGCRRRLGVARGLGQAGGAGGVVLCGIAALPPSWGRLTAP